MPADQPGAATGSQVPMRLQIFQIFIGIVVSLATIYISWQTSNTTERLKEIEQRLADSRFGFEQMRDVYDRTEKYLSSKKQDDARGRVLVGLISSLPESGTRSELLAVVTEKAKLPGIAAKAASAKANEVPATAVATTTTPANAVKYQRPGDDPRNPKVGFTGDLRLKIDEEAYVATTIGEFTFVDSKGAAWHVPKGTRFDGSAMPRTLWPIIGPPLSSDYTIPAILLNFHLSKRLAPPEQVHAMFLEALQASGVSRTRYELFRNAITLAF